MTPKPEITLAELIEFRDDMTTAVTRMETEIAALESFFAVTCIDAWPYVISLESDYPSALKTLPDNMYNFTAYGRDAMQVSKESGEKWVEHIKATNTNLTSIVRLEGKYQFFTRALESQRRSVIAFKQAIANADAKITAAA